MRNVFIRLALIPLTLIGAECCVTAFTGVGCATYEAKGNWIVSSTKPQLWPYALVCAVLEGILIAKLLRDGN